MGQPGHGIDANMGLHPEEPLITLPGLLHLRITLLGFQYKRAALVKVDKAAVFAVIFAGGGGRG